MGIHFLDHLFSPRSIAVFGASEQPDTVGGRVFDNVHSGGFTGEIYAINPKYKTLFDHPCYETITAIAKPVDLAVIATPAKTVPEIIRACGEHGVRAAIIMSAGFNEKDDHGWF